VQSGTEGSAGFLPLLLTAHSRNSTVPLGPAFAPVLMTGSVDFGVVVFAGLGQRSPGLPDDHWQHD
jgi:hypothetical protein